MEKHNKYEFTQEDLNKAYEAGKKEKVIYNPFGKEFKGTSEELKSKWREYIKTIWNS